MKGDREDSTNRQRVGCRKFTLRGCLIGLAAFVVLAALGGYVLMGQAAAPKNSSFVIDPSKIRQLAMESPGELPLGLNAVVVGEGSYPQVLVMAGSGLTPRRMIFAAYQLVYDDQTMVIDSTLPQADYEKMFPGGPFDAEGYDSIQKALRKSSLILLTHTHVDHIMGITRSPDAATLIPKVLFTQEQLEDTSADVGMTGELVSLARPITYQNYYSPIPGVVLLKSPGHSPLPSAQ